MHCVTEAKCYNGGIVYILCISDTYSMQPVFYYAVYTVCSLHSQCVYIAAVCAHA